MDPITAVLGFGGLASQGLASYINYQSQKETNEQNLQIARDNRDWQEKMWNMQNQYNSPQAQMQRLKSAGLNPDLMYSQGTTGIAQGISEPSQATMQAPQLQGLDTSSLVQSIQNEHLLQGQLDLLRSQKDNVDADTHGKDVDNQNKQLGYDLQFDEARYRIRRMQSDIDKQTQDIQESMARVGLINAQVIKTQQEASNLLQEYLFNQETWNDRVKEIQSRTHLNEANARYLAKQTQLVALQMIGQQTQNEILRKECDAFEQRLQKELRQMDDQHNVDEAKAVGMKYENRRLQIDADKAEQRWRFTNKKRTQNFVLSTAYDFTEMVGDWVENLGQGLRLFTPTK